MRIAHAPGLAVLTWMLLGVAGSARANDDAALDLQPQIDATASASASRPLKIFGELAVGRLSQRYHLGSQDTRRASLDFSWNQKLSTQWRVVLSDRLDDMHPVDAGESSTLNSLREAYAGWQSDDVRQAIELGRQNLRYGPAYGFNPTDFFRDGSVRAVTSADPLAQRENRMGTVMLRGQQLWDGGAVSLAVAPKLRDGSSRKGFSEDLGATNHADRGLLAVSLTTTERTGVQAFAYHERSKGWQLGANGTWLASDATVAFVEWAGGRDSDLLSASSGQAASVRRGHRAVAGLTYTTPSKLSLTTEFQYNGFALTQSQWKRAVTENGVEALAPYLYEVQRRQDIASRRALMFYAAQKDAVLKNLDLTALVRYNAQDHSRFAWAEARYHFPRVDVALQWQGNLGNSTSEYGAQSGRSLLQLMAAFFF